MKKTKPYSVYFGGELFSAKHLVGNAYLAEAIYERSHGRYECQLPQDFDTRRRSLRGIRDQDIQALLAAGVILIGFAMSRRAKSQTA